MLLELNLLQISFSSTPSTASIRMKPPLIETCPLNIEYYPLANAL